MDLQPILDIILGPIGIVLIVPIAGLLAPIVTALFVAILMLVIQAILLVDDLIIDALKKLIPPIGNMVQKAYIGALIKFRDKLNLTIEKVKD
jgi:hypothetical protein